MLPGMPTATFMFLGAVVGTLGYASNGVKKRRAAQVTIDEQQKAQKEAEPKERTEDLLKVDAMGLEIGYGLIPLVDANQGGDLLTRISSIRSQLAQELGIIVPPIRIRDNIQLGANEYRIMVKGIRVAGYELMLDHLLAINPGFVEEKLDGFETKDPAYGLNATWIQPNLKELAEAKNFTVVEPSSVVATHLTETIRNAAAEILTRQDVQHLVDTLKEDCPALVDSVIPDQLSLSTLHKILQSLLKERVPVRDMATIVETASDYYSATKDADVLTEYVRMSLKRQISELYKDSTGKISVFTIDPTVEQTLSDAVQGTKQGLMLVLDPAMTETLIEKIGIEAQRLQGAGKTAVCICSPNIRLALRRLVEAAHPSLAVVSYNEILPEIEIISTGMVRLNDAD
jgi:flagellar biosynthesis protein FlhA